MNLSNLNKKIEQEEKAFEEQLIQEYYEKAKNLQIKMKEIKEIEKEKLDQATEDFAESFGYRKKDNSIDKSAIKKGLLKDALLIKFNNKKNDLKEKLEILESYIEQLETVKNESDIYEIFVEKFREEEMLKNEIKDLKDDFKTNLDKGIIKAIDKIIKEELSDKKTNKEDENIKEEIRLILQKRAQNDK